MNHEHPFSRSYGVILPSSLTRVIPLTLGFSPRLPVSVCGTGTLVLARGFLGSVKSGTSVLNFPPHHSSSVRWTDLPIHHSRCLDAHNQSRASLILLRHPMTQTDIGGTGMSTVVHRLRLSASA